MRKKTHLRDRFKKFLAILVIAANTATLMASSYREAPLIASDPLADNTDLYGFRCPDNPNNVTLIANYIPAELRGGGPNYNSFSENVRSEVHIDKTHGCRARSQPAYIL